MSAVSLADLTTLRIGGEVSQLVEARTQDEVISAVASADEAGRTLLVLGGGSNLVVSDDPFEGTVVQLRDPRDEPALDATCDISGGGAAGGLADPRERTPLEATCGGATIEHFAGTPWDEAVSYAVDRGMIGIEALSGIPGTVGATPIQNVGAYGQEVSQTIARVRTFDRHDRTVRTFAAGDCGFGYRDSLFKRTPYEGAVPSPTGRYVVLSVTFQHSIGSLSAPIRYGELAARLGVEAGGRAPMSSVREAVLEIRGGKGMVLDPTDHDTWSAGSFFTNPILDAEAAAGLPEGAPRFEAGNGRIKTSAAWLITHAGFDRGFRVGPRASLSTKHSLAITNRGGASSEDIAELARAVRDGVQDTFGIRLEPEPVRIGLDI